MEFKDYYKILNVSRDAETKDIKHAYRRLARKYHPDVSTEDDAEARFKEVAEAYAVLKDPDKRAAYDQVGQGWHGGEDFRPPPNWSREYHFDEGDFGDSEAFSDFFESIFGRKRGQGGGRSSGFQDFRARGQDAELQITIPIEDSFNGATRTITLEIPEHDESGRMKRRRRELRVKIPRGVKEGQRIRVEGQGGSGHGGGGSGDLYLRVAFEPNKRFRAEGRDIFSTVRVTPWQAALGRTVKVPTLGGEVDMKIPAGASSGKRLRLKGRGLPGKPPGDHYVEIQISVPRDMDAETKALYEQLEERAETSSRVK